MSPPQQISDGLYRRHHSTTRSAPPPPPAGCSLRCHGNTTSSTANKASRLSRPLQRFWMDSDEEADDGSLTTMLVSRSTMPSADITSQVTLERSTVLPDYGTLYGSTGWQLSGSSRRARYSN
ncbi:uncharacterized protein LOC135110271 isoform X2 [Scylla paramamosain]|uniref:uncharacterized protein LOC135110271 isoform X2 n=1 Tax=Scylla paramamosain TaxID=85552 RepID=UPI0030827F46